MLQSTSVSLKAKYPKSTRCAERERAKFPSLSRRSADLVVLAAWRWGLSDTKAAWRLVRLCGLRRAAP